MFSLSVKSRYGLAAMYELALHSKEGALQTKAIAQAHHIPSNYLEQVLVELKKGGLVQSSRGCNGGYWLAKAASQIQIYDILLCLEGPLELANSGDFVLNSFWQSLQKKIQKLLSQTLDELIQEKAKQTQILTFSI